jgi:hypothetical protein
VERAYRIAIERDRDVTPQRTATPRSADPVADAKSSSSRSSRQQRTLPTIRRTRLPPTNWGHSQNTGSDHVLDTYLRDINQHSRYRTVMLAYASWVVAFGDDGWVCRITDIVRVS